MKGIVWYNSALPYEAERKSTMAKKPLTADEIASLRNSPYVADVKTGKISFTPEFKKVMYERLINGQSIRETLEEHGIDAEILGDHRLWNIAQKLRAKAQRDEGFADLREKNNRKPAIKTETRTLEERIEQLEHELAYAKQQIEFLKKIHVADLEARKLWESRQSQKKSSQ